MKANALYAIFIVLLFFLAITAVFWFRVWKIEDLPLAESSTPPVLSAQDAAAFIKLAQELLVDYKEPLPPLYGRGPFTREVSNDQSKVVKKIEPSDRFVLSSIVHSPSYALAVVNGEIIAEGDTIYDRQSGSQFMVANIEIDKVEIIDFVSDDTPNGEKKYTLKVAPKLDKR